MPLYNAAIFVQTKVFQVATVAVAQLLTVPSYVDTIQLSGYRTAGIGGGTWVRTTSATQYNSTFTTADGATWQLSGDKINVCQFGAYGNGITDDQSYIQQAFNYVSRRVVTDSFDYILVHLEFPSGLSFKVGSRILMPFGFSSSPSISATKNVLITGYGAEIVGSGSTDASHDIFESAYWDGATAVSTIGTADESHLTYNVVMRGLVIKDCRRAIYLQNWNHGCEVSDIYGVRVQSVLDAERCFYTRIKKVIARGAPTEDTKPGIRLEQFVNIEPLIGCVSANHATGYYLSGIDGSGMEDCSIETTTNGVVLGNVNMFTFSRCYIEGNTNAAIKVEGQVYQMIISGCWINQDSAKLLDTSSVGNASYVAVDFIGNRYYSGNFALEANVLGNFYGSAKESSAAAMPFTGNHKVINHGASQLIETTTSGYAGTLKLADGSTVTRNPGIYRGSFGNDPPDTNLYPYQTYSVAGETTYLDTLIDFHDNTMGTWIIRYTHSGGTFLRHYWVMGEPGGGGTTMNLLYWNGSALVEENSGNITATDNGGKIRFTILQHTSKVIVKSIFRIF